MAKISNNRRNLVPVEQIERSIIFVRGQRVMLDADLAKLYGVGTKVFNQAIKRNFKRFPSDSFQRITISRK